MRSVHTQNQKAFTLIESSIVLVIIGLIVGGITAGVDLVRAAEERAAIKQFEEFDTVTWFFKSKYGGLPGDARLSNFGKFATRSGGNALGDGDGAIEHGRSGRSEQCGEVLLFWSDLYNAELISGASDVITSASLATSCITGGVSLNPDTNMSQFFPRSKFDEAFILMNSDSTANGNGGLVKNFGHAYVLTRPSNVSHTYGAISSASHVIEPHSAYNLDLKIDDGAPNSGNVRSVGVAIGGYVVMEPSGGCVTSDEYRINSNNVAHKCSLIVKAKF